MNDARQELDRLADLLPVYLCEHTGLSMPQVLALLDAQEEFWDNQPQVVGRMIILGVEVDTADDEEDPGAG